MQCVKSFEEHLYRVQDIEVPHISEVGHACVTNMDAMFA